MTLRAPAPGRGRHRLWRRDAAPPLERRLGRECPSRGRGTQRRRGIGPAGHPAAPTGPRQPRGRGSDRRTGCIVEPLGYVAFLSVVAGARLVLTDSGGIQRGDDDPRRPVPDHPAQHGAAHRPSAMARTGSSPRPRWSPRPARSSPDRSGRPVHAHRCGTAMRASASATSSRRGAPPVLAPRSWNSAPSPLARLDHLVGGELSEPSPALPRAASRRRADGRWPRSTRPRSLFDARAVPRRSVDDVASDRPPTARRTPPRVA